MGTWGVKEGAEVFHGGEATVAKARFGFDAGYMDGEAPLLILTLENTTSGENWRKLYSIGRGWEVADSGKRVLPDTREFNENTNYARMFLAALEVAGDVIRERGYPHDATIWEGLTFRWEERTFPGIGGKDLEIVVPVALVGQASDSAPAASSGGGDVEAKLRVMAASADTADAFLEAVVESPLWSSVKADPSLKEAVVSGEFYATA